jgi:hypothetical protein
VNRVIDYCGFAMRFVGVGYVALLPLAAPGTADGVCQKSVPEPYLCYLPHVFTLPPGLHLIGLACLSGFGMSVIARQLVRWWRGRAQRALVLTARMPAALIRPRASRRPVKPRRHFGLRGVPH